MLSSYFIIVPIQVFNSLFSTLGIRIYIFFSPAVKTLNKFFVIFTVVRIPIQAVYCLSTAVETQQKFRVVFSRLWRSTQVLNRMALEWGPKPKLSRRPALPCWFKSVLEWWAGSGSAGGAQLGPNKRHPKLVWLSSAQTWLWHSLASFASRLAFIFAVVQLSLPLLSMCRVEN